MSRECGSCTKCCGWLIGEAHGHKFWPGRKCHFVTSSGCSIYEKRPERPCKSFKCVWLGDDNFPISVDTIPMWMKPDQTDIIMIWKPNEDPDLSYIQVIEAGSFMKADVLSWIIHYALNNNLNISYQVNGGWNKIGNQKFLGLEEPDERTSYTV